MPSTRFAWLIASVLLIALAAGCGGGSEPETEADAPPPAPPGDSAEDAGLEVLEEDLDEGGSDIATDVYPVVEMRTNAGTLTLELYPDKAPKTVDNFLHYVRVGFYDGTIFHRVRILERPSSKTSAPGARRAPADTCDSDALVLE